MLIPKNNGKAVITNLGLKSSVLEKKDIPSIPIAKIITSIGGFNFQHPTIQVPLWHAFSVKKALEWCARGDLNPHVLSNTGT